MDFNQDDRDDFLVTNEDSSDLSLYLGNEAGTFEPEEKIGVAFTPRMATASDYNNDGMVDLAVAGAEGTVAVLIASDDGEFVLSGQHTVGADPYSIVTDDINSDEFEDLIVLNRSSVDVSLLLGAEGGAFLDETRVDLGRFARSLTTGDVDRDGNTGFYHGDRIASIHAAAQGDGCCAIGNITFPHEVGHTVGCSHDRQNTGFGVFSFSFGHLFQDGNGINRRTIMGVSSGSRIQRFSNPGVLFNGVATGIASGPSAADNARTHDVTGVTVAAHRDEMGCTPFAILTQPADEQACVGSTASFSVGVFEESAGAVTYQWRRNIIPIPGATSATLTIENAQPADAAIYDVVVSNECTSFSSDIVQLSVDDPSFISQPQSQTVEPGDDVVFTVEFGVPGSQIFWLKDGQLILGATNTDTLTLLNVDESDEASYTANAIAPCGTIVSDPATLTVGAPAGCNGADLAEPFGTLDFSDVIAFLAAFGASEAPADLAAPFGTFDFSDVIAFLGEFGDGCP